MKEVVVISGKGGTGKTSVVAAFASLAQNAVMADCDVDAADLHLILEPEIQQESDFSGGKTASINPDTCVGCGKCEQLCRFDAIHPDSNSNGDGKKYAVDPVSCEGCKVCVEFCPAQAISFDDAINGKWFVSSTRFGPMVHAKLGIAEENSGKLVCLIRQKAKEIAEQQNRDLVIVDGSPGIGCPVIASITGADLVMVVTEPTLSGMHDFDRVADLASRFGIKTTLCVNKADINPEMTEKIIEHARERNVKVIGQIPYDESVTKAQILKVAITEYTGGFIAGELKKIWQQVLYNLG